MLTGCDFAAHNAEVAALWDAFAEGRAWRVPVIVGTNSRYFLFSEAANPAGISFREYSEDPAKMMAAELQFANWSRHNILQDAELGLPSGWNLRVDFQNYYEAAWFGCPIEYIEDQVPDTLPVYGDDSKAEVFRRGLPDPWSGLMARNLEYYQYMKARQSEGYTYLGRPIESVGLCAMGTDGPLTVAYNIRGATEFCLDLLADPGYAQELLDFITEATIQRITAYRRFLGEPVVRPSFGFADDSVQTISTELYERMILPCHKKLIAAFADPDADPWPVSTELIFEGKPKPVQRSNSIHLCGDSTRHFPLIKRELGVMSFDTGFPIDFGWVRQALGPEVTINGGPHVELLRQGPAALVRDEVKRIFETGILEGRRFVLREGNNLAPYTPLEHIRAMYDAARELGVYEATPSLS